MYFLVEKDKALSAAKKALSVIVPNSTVPQLSGVFIDANAEDGEVVFTSTNIESTVRCAIPAKVKENGSVLVHAGLLCSMLMKAGDSNVIFREVGSDVVFQSGRTQYTINTIAMDKYPKPQIPDKACDIAVKNFQSLIRQTGFAASRDIKADNLYKNIKLEAKSKSLVALGTDTFRLAKKSEKLVQTGKFATLIPIKAAATFAMMVDNKDTVKLCDLGDKAVLYTDNITFATRASTSLSSFLDADTVISSASCVYFAIVDIKGFEQAMATLSTIAGVYGTVRIVINDDGIELACTGELGTAKAFVEASITEPMNVKSEEYHYGFKAFYPALKAMGGNAKLTISDKGMLIFKTSEQVYAQTKCRQYVLKKEKAKNENKTKKSKAA